MKISNANSIISKFKELLKGTNGKSKLLSDKFCSVLEEIPELIAFINEDKYHNTKLILEELSQNMEIIDYRSGKFIRKILEKNDDFYMILSGCVLELEIKYISIKMTFKEYIIFLTKLYLLKENYLYYDCLEKNNEIFPFQDFKNYVIKLRNEYFNRKVENEKNDENSNKKIIHNINIISICNDINTKDFNYKQELKILKKNIKNSHWFKRKEYLNKENVDLNVIINYFMELYNFNGDNIDINFSEKETKYSVYIPYFLNKKVLKPISFIGNLAKPQKMKNYKGFICLTDCYTIYLDKNLLKPNQPIYRLSNKEKNHSEIDNLFKSHHLFKNIEVEYLNKNFGKYFQMVFLKKNDVLFKQNEPHKGIYIISEGLFQLKTIKSYNELNDLNFTLLHSLDNYSQYITKIKTEQIAIDKNFTEKKRYLKDYYDYNSNTNNIMRNPIFAEKAKEKSEIFFCTYGKNDILGLGEIFSSKTNINIFTAKCISDEAVLFYLPNEIFNGLISNDKIYKKCAIIIEEKINTLTRCISRYKNIFEKKIEYNINNNDNDINNPYLKRYLRTSLTGKKRPIKGYENILKKENNIGLYKSISDFYTINERKLITNKEENDKNITIINKNYQNIYDNLNNDKDYIITNKPQEVQNNLDFQNKNSQISKKKSPSVPNFVTQSKNYNSLLFTSPKLDKLKSLNEINKNRNNSPLFLGTKNMKNQILKSSSSFLNDDRGIKKRMEEITRFYSGNKKRYSGPIIISYMGSINNMDDKKNKFIFDDSKKLKIKLNKDNKEKSLKLKGRCLSAQRYDENELINIFNANTNSFKKGFEYQKNKAEFGIFDDNSNEFSNKKRNIISPKRKISNKQKKITINKFSPTTLFPPVYNTNTKNK